MRLGKVRLLGDWHFDPPRRTQCPLVIGRFEGLEIRRLGDWEIGTSTGSVPYLINGQEIGRLEGWMGTA